MDRPKIICLTPVKNEAWILERFLKCASTWADHIIVADQNSDDGSREIAARFLKVTLIENRSESFNEPERQKLLISEARKIPGPKLLIALDADEFLSANFASTTDWELIQRAVPGTVITFQWACVLPDRKSYYLYPAEFPLGMIDDGSEHEGKLIHSPRLPIRQNMPRIATRGIRVLHFSTTDFDRFRSKIRWYQCYEYLKGRWDGRFVELYRWYHRDFYIPPEQKLALPAEWVDGYKPEVDLLDVKTSPYYRWDREMLQLFQQHGTKRFRKLAVWDVNWADMHKAIYGTPPPADLEDPRTPIDRNIQSYLEKTQRYYSHFAPKRRRRDVYRDRVYRKLAKIAGW